MGNCECLRNPEDPNTEIHANVKLRNYDNDYESTVKGRAKNINNFILDEEDGTKNSEPPIKEDRVEIAVHEEEPPAQEETYQDFAMTFKKEKEEPHAATAMHEEQVEDKPLDRSAISGESDIEGGKIFYNNYSCF